MAITFESVCDAADALQAAGQSVTNAAVRKALGNTGSFSTIAAGLKAWREQALPSAATPAESLPTAVQKAIERAGKMIWQEALTIAAGETETIRQTCLQDAAQARQELAEAVGYADALSEQNESLNARCAALAQGGTDDAEKRALLDQVAELNVHADAIEAHFGAEYTRAEALAAIVDQQASTIDALKEQVARQEAKYVEAPIVSGPKGSPGAQVSETPAVKAKRGRRTKAEMQAARAVGAAISGDPVAQADEDDIGIPGEVDPVIDAE